jgi:hypothetical protein
MQKLAVLALRVAKEPNTFKEYDVRYFQFLKVEEHRKKTK